MHRLHLVDFIGDINRQRYGPHGPFHRLYLAFRGSKRRTNSLSLFSFLLYPLSMTTCQILGLAFYTQTKVSAGLKELNEFNECYLNTKVNVTVHGTYPVYLEKRYK